MKPENRTERTGRNRAGRTRKGRTGTGSTGVGLCVAPKLRSEPTLIEASLSPLPLELVRSALPRQAELPVPAKLVLTESGVGALLAEVPRHGERAHCEARAHQAIETALSWLEEDLGPRNGELPGECNSFKEEISSEAIEQALGLLPWEWEAIDGSGYRVHALGPLLDCRVEVRTSEGPLWASTLPTGLEGSGARVAEALQTFALEANRRLRLARLTISETDGHAFCALWDAPLALGVDPDPALAEVVEAVVCARAETVRSLRALCHPPVAETYLRFRSAGDGARRRTIRAK